MTTKIRNARAGFRRGESTYKCECCRRLTRRVDQSSNLCTECWELAGIENSVYDRCATPEDARVAVQYVDVIVARGGDLAKVRRNFADLFAWCATHYQSQYFVTEEQNDQD